MANSNTKLYRKNNISIGSNIIIHKHTTKRACKLLLIALFIPLISNCGNLLNRLEEVGRTPKLSAIDNPTTRLGYQPINMPMPEAEKYSHNPNSLWRSGSRAFFKDQRASKVGDILTINIRITDEASVKNSSKRERNSSEDFGINALGGLTTKIDKLLPSGGKSKDLVDYGSKNSSAGSGSVNRAEVLTVTMAAIVTQVLPNGNLVIEGKQEVRVNYEIRELLIAGVVRPEDISATNQIESSKIAEARISYGGRGQISDAQQPRYGQQLLDVLLPF